MESGGTGPRYSSEWAEMDVWLNGNDTDVIRLPSMWESQTSGRAALVITTPANLAAEQGSAEGDSADAIASSQALADAPGGLSDRLTLHLRPSAPNAAGGRLKFKLMGVLAC